jgi:polar amino acid transport system ATP-binding protein/sulfate transport system ATP-binding protein
VLLSAKDVSLTLGGTRILDQVNFEIRDRIRPGVTTGQVVALLGPSGVGKTRLLRLIAALDRPDSGLITGMNGSPFSPGEVGVVFQQYPVLKHRTVEGNLVVAGIANGMSHAEAKERTRVLLERFRLLDRAKFYPGQLSGGQRQRVAIAQQLVKPKTYLLMDEPFSGLDPQALEEVIKLVVEVANMNELNTIILVTHDIWAAMVASDLIFLLGRERTPEGAAIPGARIRQIYDLAERGLAWQTGIDQQPKFLELERELRARFKAL